MVALSGGVDSAVAALLLLEQGFEVQGIHFLLSSEKLISAEKVRLIANELGVELEVRDISREFQKEVVDSFAKTYQKGATPNPCVICNRKVKFKQLLQAREELGCDLVATGHYARIAAGEGSLKAISTQSSQSLHLRQDYSRQALQKGETEGFFLQKAKDQRKDQSYFLYRLTQEQLQFCRFPLGEHFKDWVKQRAKDLNLGLERQGESQDICFFEPEESLRDFLGRRSKQNFTEASIISDKGEPLGKCEGLELFTIGQRKGLNLSGGPWYVLNRDFTKRQLVVTRDSESPDFWQKGIFIEQVNWINQSPQPGKWYDLQIRYQGKVYQGMLEKLKEGLRGQGGGYSVPTPTGVAQSPQPLLLRQDYSRQALRKGEPSWKVSLKEAARAVAAGQSLVVYEGSQVLGGGIIF